MASREHLDAANAGGLLGVPRRYRKKPVVIEAVRIASDPDQIGDVLRWIRDNGGGVRAIGEDEGPGAVLEIETLEGPMRAAIGWWIIRGVKGEFYPCDPEVFDLSYDPA